MQHTSSSIEMGGDGELDGVRGDSNGDFSGAFVLVSVSMFMVVADEWLSSDNLISTFYSPPLRSIMTMVVPTPSLLSFLRLLRFGLSPRLNRISEHILVEVLTVLITENYLLMPILYRCQFLPDILLASFCNETV